MICPLCNQEKCKVIGTSKLRIFFKCENCTFIFVPSEYHISIEEELKRYELHNNTEENKGYLNFLEKVVNITNQYITPDSKILDFGCGKNAILCKILRKKGVNITPFDPLYNFPLTSDKYDIIILCEVIEHCRNLLETIKIISSHLKENGIVIIRTRTYPLDRNICNWWYSEDITHINFFSIQALKYVATLLQRNLINTDISDIFVIK